MEIVARGSEMASELVERGENRMRPGKRFLGLLLVTLVVSSWPIGAAASSDVTFVVTKQQIQNAQAFAQFLRSQNDIQSDALADVVVAASQAMQRNDAIAYNDAHQELARLNAAMPADVVARAEQFAKGLPLGPRPEYTIATECDAYCVFGSCSIRNCNGTASCSCILFFPSCSCSSGGYLVSHPVPTLSTWGLVLAGLLLVVPAIIWLRRHRSVA